MSPSHFRTPKISLPEQFLKGRLSHDKYFEKNRLFSNIPKILSKYSSPNFVIYLHPVVGAPLKCCSENFWKTSKII